MQQTCSNVQTNLHLPGKIIDVLFDYVNTHYNEINGP